jgi:flagellar biosynthesis/type III secretory pathway M-ring protein FliF/YscJ
MAAKRKKKKSRLKTLALWVVTPLLVWFFAFVIWFYWNPIMGLLSQGKDQAKAGPKAARNRDKAERSNLSEKHGHEQISDEERKRLDEILKREPHSY